MLQKIKAREIRLLIAVGALLIFAVATTTPDGGLTCSDCDGPKMALTFINNHTENQGLGLLPNIVVLILDAKSSGGIKTIKIPLNVGQSKTESVPEGFYFYTAFELEYSIFDPTKPKPGKCIDTGVLIADATITIN